MEVLNNTNNPAVLEKFIFGGIDYLVFLIMLGFSAGIGVYFGFFAKSADTTDEYLMGGRKMKTIPIAISLVASQLSAISIMTLPSEMYVYGVNYIFSVLMMVFIVPIICWIIIPVFYNNNISNCYEYLELRFNRATRELVTVASMGTIFIFLPVFIFVPSLAFAQVTSFNVHLINTIISSICMFYTMLGGIKAVVWTDVLQATIMLFSVVFVGIMGVVKVGGLTKVLEIASDGGRLTPNFSFDLKSRMTFWNTIMNSTIVWTAYVGLNQSCVQRIVSLPTLAHAKRTLTIFGIGFVIIMGFNCFTGIIMYAMYHDCDPLKSGQVTKLDKLVPHLVQDVVGHLAGFPGLFISCVFSAALSTLSASMNALAGVIYMDYMKPRIRHTEHRANIIMKGIVFLFGIYCILGGFAVEKFASILQLGYSIGGVTFGAVFGVFMLGMLVPRAHGKAALWSVIVSMATMLAIIVGAQGRLHYQFLPTSTAGCALQNASFVSSTNASFVQNLVSHETTNDFNIFEMSISWYVVVGTIIVFFVSVPLSYLLPPEKYEKFDPKLLTPCVQRFAVYQLAQPEELTDIKEKIDFK